MILLVVHQPASPSIGPALKCHSGGVGSLHKSMGDYVMVVYVGAVEEMCVVYARVTKW